MLITSLRIIIDPQEVFHNLPKQEGLLKRSMKRRDFIKYFGAGLAGPAFRNLFNYKKSAVEHLVPYVVPPAGIVPGLPTYYNSVCRQCSAGCGIEVKIREGRAKKLEGNAEFPVNFGKLCSRGQAGLQVVYGPDRLTTPLIKKKGEFEQASWPKALKVVADRLRNIQESGKSNKVVYLTEPLRGTLAGLFKTFAESLGGGDVFSYDPLNDDGLLAANELCFGERSFPHYDIGNADYLVSFGANFLDTWATPIKHSAAFGEMRDRERGVKGSRGLLVQFESRLSVTGASADEWYGIKPGTEGEIALAMAHVIVAERLFDESIAKEADGWLSALKNFTPDVVAKRAGIEETAIKKTAKEFAEHDHPLAICGGPGTAQKTGTLNAVAANILNHLVGNIGKRGGVIFNEPSLLGQAIEKTLTYAELAELARSMAAGDKEALFILNVNPVHTTPARPSFKRALKNTPFKVSLSSFMDETTAECDVVLPSHTYLESWGDYVPLTDTGRLTIGLMQPAVAPLHDTKETGDILLLLANKVGARSQTTLKHESYLGVLQESWQNVYQDGRARKLIEEPTFESFWAESVRAGGWWLDESRSKNSLRKPRPALIAQTSSESKRELPGEIDLVLYPSHAHYDGRHANLPWLQQFPEPLVLAAWGSWLELGPETAKELDVVEDDVVELKTEHGKIEVPVYIYYGLGPGTAAIALGQGHTNYGRYATNRGANAFKLLGDAADETSGGLAWAHIKAEVRPTNNRVQLVKTEPELDLPGLEDGLREVNREIVKWIGPEEAEKSEGRLLEPIEALPSRDLKKGPHFLSGLGLGKYRQSQFHDYEYRWGMVIDLDKCTGCGACMVACYAENNLPLVDEVELRKKRHKNWIRIDRYWEGEFPKIRAKTIPINCFQCGNAPCESVCPVYAAYHTNNGLNGQVYQRCVGTRYCNVNCPYRARLFNWFNSEWPKPLDMQLNPDLSVRSSGITDKCSFCVQRIRFAKDKAKDEARKVRDGEITTACAQTCPTGAITFGDLIDHETKVSMLTRSARRYRIFEKVMNTEPAVVYLAAVREGKHEAEGIEGDHGETEEDADSSH